VPQDLGPPRGGAGRSLASAGGAADPAGRWRRAARL